MPIMSKIDQKRNWVKLESVQTLLRIDGLADRKSYVVIICAPIHVKSIPKVKLCQVEVDSNIAQNHFHSSKEILSAHYLHKCI